jgi:flagellar protein FlbD
MIKVTRLNGSELWVNAEMIEFVEATPDTVISLVTHTKFVVRDSPQAIVEEVIDYRRRIHHQTPPHIIQAQG